MKGEVIKSIPQLLAHGLIKPEEEAALAPVTSRYAVAITEPMQALINKQDAQDPIALQFVPDAREMVQTNRESEDPIGDHAHSPVQGIVHRYPDRVLLKAVHSCPVYCRFCFRREMVGPQGDGTLNETELDAALAYIAAHEDIWEVILTGGDPLVLSPRRLTAIMQGLARIDHVKIVRFHSRVPVVEPKRIDDALIHALKASGKTIYIAVHSNHPRELTVEAEAAIGRLDQAGFALLSQTVLLKGINNDVQVLATLMRRFVELKIRPYYLHHLDLAPGTGHFRVSIAEGQKLVKALRGHISGLCQPSYVLDIPGGFGKAVIAQSPIQPQENGYLVHDYHGQPHVYLDDQT